MLIPVGSVHDPVCPKRAPIRAPYRSAASVIDCHPNSMHAKIMKNNTGAMRANSIAKLAFRVLAKLLLSKFRITLHRCFNLSLRQIGMEKCFGLIETPDLNHSKCGITSNPVRAIGLSSHRLEILQCRLCLS